MFELGHEVAKEEHQRIADLANKIETLNEVYFYWGITFIKLRIKMWYNSFQTFERL